MKSSTTTKMRLLLRVEGRLRTFEIINYYGLWLTVHGRFACLGVQTCAMDLGGGTGNGERRYQRPSHESTRHDGHSAKAECQGILRWLEWADILASRLFGASGAIRRTMVGFWRPPSIASHFSATISILDGNWTWTFRRGSSGRLMHCPGGARLLPPAPTPLGRRGVCAHQWGRN
jgi:hypothetical protein